MRAEVDRLGRTCARWQGGQLLTANALNQPPPIRLHPSRPHNPMRNWPLVRVYYGFAGNAARALVAERAHQNVKGRVA